VFDEYQRLQRELERQPVEFLARRYKGLIEDARTRLAEYVGARPDDLIFVPNASSGMNVVARSLPLGPRDEVLVTNHEYGGVDLLWQHVCGRTGATLVRRVVEAGPGLADELWSAVTPRTRVVSLSHITSATALRLPVEELGRRARAEGILIAIDGAHAPGQIDLDLDSLGADFYAGNCHNWGYVFTRTGLRVRGHQPGGYGQGQRRPVPAIRVPTRRRQRAMRPALVAGATSERHLSDDSLAELRDRERVDAGVDHGSLALLEALIEPVEVLREPGACRE
jgi:phage tail protein X